MSDATSYVMRREEAEAHYQAVAAKLLLEAGWLLRRFSAGGLCQHYVCPPDKSASIFELKPNSYLALLEYCERDGAHIVRQSETSRCSYFAVSKL